MKLEERVAQWVDLGVMPFSETSTIQNKLADMRRKGEIPDTIISVQHPHEISFGTSEEDNQFSDKFLSEVYKSLGRNFNEEDIKNYLISKGIEFSRSKRGGGATVLSPGQKVYYPIVDYEEVTGKPMGVSEYKAKIYRVMFETLHSMGVEGININQKTADSTLINRGERKDIWMRIGNKPYKLGSKGLKISSKIAYYGFSLYIDKEGLKNFWMVNPCGYVPEEVGTISVEEVIGKRIPHEMVDNKVKDLIKKNFGYSQIKEISKDDLFSSQIIGSTRIPAQVHIKYDLAKAAA